MRVKSVCGGIVLLLDIGNSRSKWAWVEQGSWLRSGVYETAELDGLCRTLAALPSPGRVLVSNVAGEHAADQVRTLCQGWGLAPEFVQASSQQCGVRNGYEQPERLGSDRWAALIAAWQRTRGACLVVNCGTATTVDALSARGEFLGGLILPGVQMMRQALVRSTAQLRDEAGKLCDFPRNTADALYSGAVVATLGAIRHQHALLEEASAPCLLSGGAAIQLPDVLGIQMERIDNLVLHGLQVIGETGAC